MSKKVKTRNSTQCHTHHQKMIGKHKTIEGIIEHYESLFEANKRKENTFAIDHNEPQQAAISLEDTPDTHPETERPVLEPDLRLDLATIMFEYRVEDELFEEYF